MDGSFSALLTLATRSKILVWSLIVPLLLMADPLMSVLNSRYPWVIKTQVIIAYLLHVCYLVFFMLRWWKNIHHFVFDSWFIETWSQRNWSSFYWCVMKRRLGLNSSDKSKNVARQESDLELLEVYILIISLKWVRRVVKLNLDSSMDYVIFWCIIITDF